MRHLVLVPAMAFTIVLASAGCSASSPGTAVDAAFRDKALAVCHGSLASKQAWQAFPAGTFDPVKPDPAKLPTVAGWLQDQVAPTFHAWRDDLKALGAPATGQPAWDAVITEITATAAGNDDQIAAAIAADPVAFAAATSAIRASEDRLRTATKAAGVDACADIVAP